MALRSTCDVFLTAVEGVEEYRVTVERVDRKTKHPVKEEPEVQFGVDLCPRALTRLVAKIETGTTPPVERKKKNDVPTEPKPGEAALAK